MLSCHICITKVPTTTHLALDWKTQVKPFLDFWYNMMHHVHISKEKRDVPIVAQVWRMPLTVFWLKSCARALVRRWPKRWLLSTFDAVICMRNRNCCICFMKWPCLFLHSWPFQCACTFNHTALQENWQAGDLKLGHLWRVQLICMTFFQMGTSMQYLNKTGRLFDMCKIFACLKATEMALNYYGQLP